jgi:hypothetical protein
MPINFCVILEKIYENDQWIELASGCGHKPQVRHIEAL